MADNETAAVVVVVRFGVQPGGCWLVVLVVLVVVLLVLVVVVGLFRRDISCGGGHLGII